jgi:hypothetical protein
MRVQDFSNTALWEMPILPVWTVQTATVAQPAVLVADLSA